MYASHYSVAAKNKALKPVATLSAVTTQSLASDINEIDSDNDGLKDWEEALWKSDPQNPDTDEDGTKDGAEVQAGRNPIVKGPNDKVSTVQQVATISNATTTATTTQTGNIARELFANYIDLKKSGKDITPDMENQIIQNTLLVADYGEPVANVYSSKDIHIISDISNTALRNYANAMGAVFRNNSPHTDDNEFAIMSRAVDSRDGNEIAKLDPLIDSYNKIVQGMIKVPVPSELAALHLNFINAFSAGLEADKQMRRLFDDAAQSLVGLKQYEDAAIKISDTHQSFVKYYQDQSIEFNQNEDGYGFLHMIAHK